MKDAALHIWMESLVEQLRAAGAPDAWISVRGYAGLSNGTHWDISVNGKGSEFSSSELPTVTDALTTVQKFVSEYKTPDEILEAILGYTDIKA